jgi:hypothetical protein
MNLCFASRDASSSASLLPPNYHLVSTPKGEEKAGSLFAMSYRAALPSSGQLLVRWLWALPTYALQATFLIIVPFKHSFPYNNTSACAFPLEFTIQRIFPGQSQQPNITTWLPFQITTLKASVDGVDPSNHTSFSCCTSGGDGKTQWLTLVKGSDSRSKEGNLWHFLHRLLLQRFQMISDLRLNCRHHDCW